MDFIESSPLGLKIVAGAIPVAGAIFRLVKHRKSSAGKQMSIQFIDDEGQHFKERKLVSIEFQHQGGRHKIDPNGVVKTTRPKDRDAISGFFNYRDRPYSFDISLNDEDRVYTHTISIHEEKKTGD